MPFGVAIILGTIAALTLTVLIMIFVTPEKKRGGLNKFFTFLHDLFNFKFLILEKILKALYIFATFSCICVGFFGLFSVEHYWGSYYRSYAFPSLLLLILGPIALRITYEAIMMFILLVKNTIQINNKLGSDDLVNKVSTQQQPISPTMEQFVAPAPEYVFCVQCGTRCEKGQLTCPQCGKELKQI